MSGLTFFAFYMSPTLIAWYRKRHGGQIVLSLPQIFAINFFLGIFIVGWVIALFAAFNKNIVAWMAVRIVKFLPTGPSAIPGQVPTSGSQGTGCSMCGGSGSMMCSQCGGRGSWYNAPTTATGVAQLATCGTCTSSGRLRCTSCGGSGRSAY